MALMIFKGNAITAPKWLGDWGDDDAILAIPARVDPTQFPDDSGVSVTVDTAGAIATATSIPITALTSPQTTVQPLVAAGQVLIPSGSVLSFGIVGSGKFAKLTADGKYGDTSLSVEALPTALVSLDKAVFSFGGAEYIQSGRLLGRTYAERAAFTAFGAANVQNDDEIFLMVFDVVNARLNPDCELLRHGRQVKENYLPDYATMVADTGIADPTVAPTLGHAGTDGPAIFGLKYVGYSFTNAYGETKISPLSSVTTLTTEHISVADIAFPTGATGIKFYASPAPNDAGVEFVKELAAHAATTLLTDGAGPKPADTNTTKNPATGGKLDWIRRHYTCMIGVD